LKFKAEVSLLVFAIVLFAVSMFFYSYSSTAGDAAALNLSSAYPYRGLAVAFVGAGSISMLAASISYSKKTKEITAKPAV
jgi:TRAP-type C4-dicarboxylate transport system permease small subunit